ncbi:MAG: hypothetical protein G01um101430_641, partial [Parcubacteria group bacterium Gr01-1014_30]
LPLKKSFVQKIFGLNLTLHAREARGVAEIQWASVEEAHQKNSKTDLCLLLEPEMGIEPIFARYECAVLPLNYSGKNPPTPALDTFGF